MLIVIVFMSIILLVLGYQYQILRKAHNETAAELEQALQKAQQERIAELTYRDCLTGLYNRAFFEQELPKLDIPKEWPLSVIFADLNGLKLTNDIFGHSVGDDLLLEVSRVFMEVCRPEDRIFRWGGDEFIVLLPRTNVAQANELRTRLRKALEGRGVGSMNLYVPLGLSTKEDASQDMEVVLRQAEEEMYWLKTLGQKNYQSQTLERILDELYSKSEAERKHAERVKKLAEEFGEYLGLVPHELHTLKYAAYLHDIGKVAVDTNILHKPFPLPPAEQNEMKRHPLVGFRLLNFFEDTVDLANAVLAHHEHWDGNGYPKGIKGEEIPLLGRILAILETYDRVLNDPVRDVFCPEEALEFIMDGSGKKFDPQLSIAFVEMMKEKTVQ